MTGQYVPGGDKAQNFTMPALSPSACLHTESALQPVLQQRHFDVGGLVAAESVAQRGEYSPIDASGGEGGRMTSILLPGADAGDVRRWGGRGLYVFHTGARILCGDIFAAKVAHQIAHGQQSFARLFGWLDCR